MMIIIIMIMIIFNNNKNIHTEDDNNDPYGACCYLKNCQDWVCEEMYQSECSTLFDGTHWADKTCEDIDCPNFSVFELGACCVEDADGGMICYFVKETDCESYGGVWHPGIPCECEPCTPSTIDCVVTPSTNCVGRPQYPHPDPQTRDSLCFFFLLLGGDC